MSVWRARCTERFGEQWGVPWAYSQDGAIRRPHVITKGKHKVVRIRDSIFADDTAITDMNFDCFQEMTFLLDDTISAFGGEVSLKKTE